MDFFLSENIGKKSPSKDMYSRTPTYPVSQFTVSYIYLRGAPLIIPTTGKTEAPPMRQELDLLGDKGNKYDAMDRICLGSINRAVV